MDDKKKWEVPTYEELFANKYQEEPDEVEEIRKNRNLPPIRHVFGTQHGHFALRRSRERSVDFLLDRAAEPRNFPHNFYHLIEAYLANLGLFELMDPEREAALDLRAVLFRLLDRVLEKTAVEELSIGALKLAARLDVGLAPLPKDNTALLISVMGANALKFLPTTTLPPKQRKAVEAMQAKPGEYVELGKTGRQAVSRLRERGFQIQSSPPDATRRGYMLIG